MDCQKILVSIISRLLIIESDNQVVRIFEIILLFENRLENSQTSKL